MYFQSENLSQNVYLKQQWKGHREFPVLYHRTVTFVARGRIVAGFYGKKILWRQIFHARNSTLPNCSFSLHLANISKLYNYTNSIKTLNWPQISFSGMKSKGSSLLVKLLAKPSTTLRSNDVVQPAARLQKSSFPPLNDTHFMDTLLSLLDARFEASAGPTTSLWNTISDGCIPNRTLAVKGTNPGGPTLPKGFYDSSSLQILCTLMRILEQVWPQSSLWWPPEATVTTLWCWTPSYTSHLLNPWHKPSSGQFPAVAHSSLQVPRLATCWSVTQVCHGLQTPKILAGAD